MKNILIAMLLVFVSFTANANEKPWDGYQIIGYSSHAACFLDEEKPFICIKDMSKTDIEYVEKNGMVSIPKGVKSRPVWLLVDETAITWDKKKEVTDPEILAKLNSKDIDFEDLVPKRTIWDKIYEIIVVGVISIIGVAIGVFFLYVAYRIIRVFFKTLSAAEKALDGYNRK